FYGAPEIKITSRSKAEHGGLKADLSGVKQKPDQEQSDIYLVYGDPNVGAASPLPHFLPLL
ncbi:hypothetical protein, partial [Pseudomonas costantinii]|uniref:hypothetical protein n=1 Tax=Pseudomonas costantinii TaxID=168469 RepID=UPI001C431DA6